MPVKKGPYRHWWEPRVRPKDCPYEERHYYVRRHSKTQLTEILNGLELYESDERALAGLIHDRLVEKPHKLFRRGRKPGPMQQLDPVKDRWVRAVYRDLAQMIRAGADHNAIAARFDCSFVEVRKVLAKRRGVSSKARGVLVVLLSDTPDSKADDDYLRRFLLKARPRLVAPKPRR